LTAVPKTWVGPPHKPNAPQLLLNQWKIIDYLICRSALQHRHQLGYRMLRGKTQENEEGHGRGPELSAMPESQTHEPLHAIKDFFCLRPNIFWLNPLPIFRCPCEMIFCVLGRICAPPDSHDGSYTIFPLLPVDASFIPSTERVFLVWLVIKAKRLSIQAKHEKPSNFTTVCPSYRHKNGLHGIG
jgi:hypothetical protein